MRAKGNSMVLNQQGHYCATLPPTATEYYLISLPVITLQAQKRNNGKLFAVTQ